jgi:hypothetical protein
LVGKLQIILNQICIKWKILTKIDSRTVLRNVFFFKDVYKEKYEHGYEGHTLRNTMNSLSRLKSHEAYKIRANRLQES